MPTDNRREQQDTSEDPLYNIGVVSRMTGIPPSTLRVWERRYGFPHPARTAGRHRLYSRKEVERLQWVKAQVDAGMQTSQAVQALEHVEIQGRFPDSLLPAAAGQRRAPQSVGAALGEHAGAASGVSPAWFGQRLLAALLAHDTTQAGQVLAEMTAVYPLEQQIRDAIVPALRAIGAGWEAGEVSVATEHLATNYLRQYLLMWMRTAPPAYPVDPVVLACAPGEWHEMNLIIFAGLLRRLRWPVVNLGQSVPLDDLAAFIHDLGPSVLVLAATTEATARALAGWPGRLPDVVEAGRPIIAYAGRAFNVHPELTKQIQGVFLGATFEEGLETLDQMLRRMYSPAELAI